MSDAPGQDASADEDAVLKYLAAVETRRTTPPDFPEPDRIADDLATAEMMKAAADPEGLRDQVGTHTPGSESNVELLEEAFVAAARNYGRRHNMGYAAWIQAGVDPAVLERAGIHPEGD